MVTDPNTEQIRDEQLTSGQRAYLNEVMFPRLYKLKLKARERMARRADESAR